MKNTRVLIVDDSALARRTAHRYLTEMGWVVEEAVDGSQAIERYFLHRHDVVVLDMVMGDMYGLDVLQKLKAIDPQVRVVVVTADIQSSTQDQARLAGAFAFLNKPVTRDQFTRVMTDAIAHGAS